MKLCACVVIAAGNGYDSAGKLGYLNDLGIPALIFSIFTNTLASDLPQQRHPLRY